jgi:hypothetical protein
MQVLGARELAFYVFDQAKQYNNTWLLDIACCIVAPFTYSVVILGAQEHLMSLGFFIQVIWHTCPW